MDLIAEIGVAGILVLLILRELKPIFIKKLNTDDQEIAREIKFKIAIDEIEKQLVDIEKKIDAIRAKTQDLHAWHDVNFPDMPGVKAWYTTPLYSAIKELSSAVALLTERLDKSEGREK